jgi:hypothetical protein
MSLSPDLKKVASAKLTNKETLKNKKKQKLSNSLAFIAFLGINTKNKYAAFGLLIIQLNPFLRISP